MKKSAYGLYDVSREWYLAVRKELLDIGMVPLSGDDAVFYLIRNGKLIGLCLLHVDDFLTGGTQEFENMIDKKKLIMQEQVASVLNRFHFLQRVLTDLLFSFFS